MTLLADHTRIGIASWTRLVDTFAGGSRRSRGDTTAQLARPKTAH